MNEVTPAVPAHIRTAAYYVGLVLGAFTLAASGLASIWLDPGTADQVVRTCGVVSGVAAFLAGGLGAVYRPTANPTVADGTAVPITPYE